MNRLIILTPIILLVLTGGCASFSDKSTKVILQHSETMEFVSCKVDKWGTALSYERNEQCVEDYKKQGYIVWGER
jgi:hypothetical protein